MRVVFAADARAEAKDASVWYRKRDPRTVQKLRLRVREATRQLAEFPNSGQLYLEGTRRLSVAPYPYSLVYRVGDGGVRVISVPHDAQRPGYWASRD